MRPPAWLGRGNRFKENLREGRPVVAMWLTTPWAAAPEILGAAGADAVFIDLEHVSYDLETAERLIVASEAARISPLVRPPQIEPTIVSRLLDAGAHGIVFPQVQDRHDAELAVRSTQYRPKGLRGWGGAHTRFALWQGNYGGDVFAGRGSEAGVYTDRYVRKADGFPAVVLLIETRGGVERVDEIAAVPGVDAIVFGWGDYAVESGFDKDACNHAAGVVHAAAERNGVGVALSHGERFYPGCFILAGVDSLLMSSSLTAAVDAARAGIDVAVAEA